MAAVGHHFQIKKNKAGEYVTYFKYNNECIFWTEGYASKASAKNAIGTLRKNIEAAPTYDDDMILVKT